MEKYECTLLIGEHVNVKVEKYLNVDSDGNNSICLEASAGSETFCWIFTQEEYTTLVNFLCTFRDVK